MRRMLVRVLFTALLCGCSEAEPVVDAVSVAQPDPALMSQVVEEVFEGADPDAIVATTGAGDVSVAHVAAYLTLFPGLTVEQAVADLVDMRAAGATYELHEGAPEWNVRARLAALRGQTLAWVRTTASDDASLDLPTAEQIRARATDEEYATSFGTPRLATVSHLLIHIDQTASDSARVQAEALSEEIAQAWETSEFRDLDTLNALQERAANRLEEIGSPVGVEARVESGFTFPRRYSGEPTWNGLPAVVDPFADAVFAANPGDAIGPVETPFGFHFIIVERFRAADMPSESQRIVMAEERMRAELVSSLLVREAEAHAQHLDVRVIDENVPLLLQDDMERLSQEGREQASDMTGR